MYTEIKTIEDAIAVVNPDPSVLQILNTLPEPARKPIVSHYLLTLVAAAINIMPAKAGEEKLAEPWIPDWSNYDQYKYSPWLDIDENENKPSGFGLSYDVYDNSFTYSYVGSRLCFRSSDRAKYAANQFNDLYEAYFLIDKKQ